MRTPPKLGPQKIVSIIAFRIALTLDVKIVWFGRQVAVCVQNWHKNAIFGCSWSQKFNFDCLLLKSSWFFTNNGTHNQICVSFVDSVIYHEFRDRRIFHPLFGLESKFQKSDLLGHCSFTQIVHDVEKLRRKHKIFTKVIQRFWYVQHAGLMYKKNPPEAAKVATSVKFFNVEKT